MNITHNALAPYLWSHRWCLVEATETEISTAEWDKRLQKDFTRPTILACVGTNLIHGKKMHNFTAEFLKYVIFHRKFTEASGLT